MQTSVSPSKAGAADAVGGAGAVMAVDRGNWADLEGSGGGCPLHIEPVPRTALEVVITGQTNLTAEAASAVLASGETQIFLH